MPTSFGRYQRMDDLFKKMMDSMEPYDGKDPNTAIEVVVHGQEADEMFAL